MEGDFEKEIPEAGDAGALYARQSWRTGRRKDAVSLAAIVVSSEKSPSRARQTLAADRIMAFPPSGEYLQSIRTSSRALREAANILVGARSCWRLQNLYYSRE
jgi:hypothetical protein